MYIIGDAPLDLSLAAKSLVALEQISHRLHDVDFQRDVQLVTVMERTPVMIRKTARSQVQIQLLVEVADLFEDHTFLGNFPEDCAAPRGVIATTGALRQLDDLAVVIRARKFISRSQPADAGAEDHN